MSRKPRENHTNWPCVLAYLRKEKVTKPAKPCSYDFSFTSSIQIYYESTFFSSTVSFSSGILGLAGSFNGTWQQQIGTRHSPTSLSNHVWRRKWNRTLFENKFSNKGSLEVEVLCFYNFLNNSKWKKKCKYN